MIFLHFVLLILGSDHPRVNPTQISFCAFETDGHLFKGQATACSYQRDVLSEE